MTPELKPTLNDIDYQNIPRMTFVEYLDCTTVIMENTVGAEKIGELVSHFDEQVVKTFITETICKFKLMCIKPEYTARFTLALLEEAKRNMMFLMMPTVTDTKH